MTTWKKLTALAVGGCMVFGLAACNPLNAAEQKTDDSVSYAEDIQRQKEDAAEQQDSQTEELEENITVSAEQLKELEPTVAAIVNCMQETDRTEIKLKTVSEDASFVSDYLVTYFNQTADASDTYDTLGDTAYDKYYQADADAVNDTLTAALGSNVDIPVDEESIYNEDDKYYFADKDIPTVTVNYAGEDDKEIDLTEQSEFPYEYSIEVPQGMEISGELKVLFSNDPERPNQLTVEEIVIEEEAETEQPDGNTSDDSEDGEAKNEISITQAKAMVESQFGTTDPNTGYAYEYELDGIEEIGDRQYYIFKMTWAQDPEDGGAKSKVLKYIFVATDGSTIHTGTVDEDGYDIDYST